MGLEAASMVRDLEHLRQKADIAPEPNDFSWTKWSVLRALNGPTRIIHSRHTSPTPSTVTPSPRNEAHSWLNGYVNKQNCSIWSEANPQVYVETPSDAEKLTVWCALWAGGILLQKR
ncbi:hypothetical protein TNCV_184381 [Trichonephila clavipes]|nr:hypothetical protein TNCV_184381 [Trichonephila clavipes]